MIRETYSWSQLKNFQRCSLQVQLGWYAREALPRRQPTATPAFMGDVAHEVIAHLLKEEIRGGGAAIDARTLCRDELHRRGVEILPGEWTNLLDAAAQRVDRWRGIWATRFTGFQPVGVECDVVLALADGVVIGGRIDLRARAPNGDIWIIDWKTGRVTADAEAQVALYSLAEPEEANVWGAVVGVAEGIVRSFPVIGQRRRLALHQMKREFLNMHQVLGNRTALAHPGFQCRDCNFVAQCEIGRAYLENHRGATALPTAIG